MGRVTVEETFKLEEGSRKWSKQPKKIHDSLQQLQQHLKMPLRTTLIGKC